MKRFVVIISSVFLIACIPGVTNCLAEENPEGVFWKWFVENEDMIYNLDETNRQQIHEVYLQLIKIDENITFFVDARGASEKRLFVLSANGCTEYFPVIERLYAQKPELSRVEIVKFVPRRPTLAPMTVNGIKIAPEDIGFLLDKTESGKARVIFWSSQFDVDFGDEIMWGLYNMTMQAIGEYDLATMIEKVGVEPVNVMAPDIYPMTMFQQKFDEMFKE